MPRTLFAQTIVPRPTNARPLGTIAVSILLHGAALAVIVALQLTSSVRGLEVVSPLTAYVAPSTPPPEPPPLVRPPVPLPAPIVPAAPTVPSDAIPTEPRVATRPAAPSASAGLTVDQGNVGTLFPAGSGIALHDTPPPPQATVPLRVGGAIRAPARLVYLPPAYPTIALAARVEGEVVLEATIDDQGVVRDLKVLHSIPLLDRAAIDAVSRWRYSPTLLNGRAVAVSMLVRVKFSLK